MLRIGRAGSHVWIALGTVLCALAMMIAPAPAGAARPLVRGFADDVWFDAGWQQWMPRTVTTGAKRVLLEIDWAGVEPTAPRAGTDPTDPAGAQYNFAYVDAIVREFAGTGITPAFLVTDAPSWAEAPGGPAALEARGAWEPNVTAFGQLAAALARRYSGAYPDPENPGQMLPRVRYFQAWAEPNFSIHLAPQWVSSGARLVPYAPALYRAMLNAFYAGIKQANASDVVVTSGFGPYGDSPSLSDAIRTPPAQFAREMMCLNGRAALKPASCPNPAHFDVLAIDPYEFGSPTTKAYNPDDVTAPDMGKLWRIIRKAVRVGRALPRRSKQLWVTEFSYDSNPPNPSGESLPTQARWLEQSLYEFWSEHVNTVFWYLLRDQAATYNPVNYFSGVYYYNGQPKPSLEAYRFPLVAMPSNHDTVVWGISPRGGKVAVQRQRGASWSTLFTAKPGAGGVFTRSFHGSLHGNFRAVVGGETSLIWKR